MNKIDLENSCPVTACLDVIGGKWKHLILFLISNKIDRFGLLQRKIPATTKQMLTKQLCELENDGVIYRQVYAEVPPRVEYSVTEKGKSLYTIIAMMQKWGEEHLKQNITSARSWMQCRHSENCAAAARCFHPISSRLAGRTHNPDADALI